MHKKAISFLLSVLILLSMMLHTAPVVRADSGFTTSDECIEILKTLEGFSKYPYYDNGQYTVGYGTACPSTEDYQRYKAEGITEEEAEKLLRDFLDSFESSLNSFIDKNGLSMKQCQFDALLLFTYNVGSGWMSKESSFRTAVLSGATGNNLIFTMARWCTASGKVLPSLIDRRLMEANMYLNGTYATKAPSNYRYVIYNDNLDGATNDVRVQAYDADKGDIIRSMPSAQGYTFLGWYTQAEGGTKVTRLTASLGNTTLYAHWQEGDTDAAVITEATVSYTTLTVRGGPGTEYSSVSKLAKGTAVSVYEVCTVGCTTWGRIDSGWINLVGVTVYSAADNTDSEEEPIAQGTVAADLLNVRAEAGMDQSIVTVLEKGTAVRVYETKTVGDIIWGRIDNGWVCMEYLTVYTGAENLVIAQGVVTATYLRVRNMAGTTGTTTVCFLVQGTAVDIYELREVDGTLWGRVENGWICMDYICQTLDATTLDVTNVASTGKIRLSWEPVSLAAEYKVYYSTSKNSGYKLLKTLTGTELTHKSAVTGKTYYYYVVALTASGVESDASNKVKRTCDLAQPVITLSNVESTGNIRISWTAVEGAVKYEVYRAASKDGTYTCISTTTKTSVVNTRNVEAGKAYYYKVRAIAENTAANSAYSAVKYRTCDLAQPVIALSNVASTGNIRISWTAVEGAAGYEVYRATSKDGTYTCISTTTKTSVVNTRNVEAGKVYYYKVRAIAENTAANSAYSTTEYRTCDLPQPVVSIELNAKGKPRLSWEPVAGAVEYRVYVATSADGEYKLLKTLTSTALANSSAQNGQTYYYQVVAVASRAAADSAASETVSIQSN